MPVMFICINCRQGLMDPVRNEEEPEYTDRYQCGHCGHTATIPSLLIVVSQFASALIGGSVALYLLLVHLSAAVSAWQFDESKGSLQHIMLVAAAALLLGGFGYTLYRAGQNFYRRHIYLHPGI